MLNELIKHIREENRIGWEEEILKKIPEKIVEETDEKLKILYNKNNIIFPIKEKIFNFANYTKYEDIKIIIMGQDPYHGIYNYKNKERCQANGLSFSVPKHCEIPPSLMNIYKNMKKYNHINEIPKTGSIKGFAENGILLINSSLTVIKSKPNSCAEIWNNYTDEIIKILSDKKEKLIFVLWGGNSLKKLDLIDKNKHKLIISSHPSPLSVNNKLKNYESFNETDHFGLINKFLQENGNKEIEWKKIVK